MRRISSRITFFNKRAFPAIWFGLLAPTRFIPLSKSPRITELIDRADLARGKKS